MDRRIGRYITAKQKLIALLEEEKQAVISQAVTRGLDPQRPLSSPPVSSGWRTCLSTGRFHACGSLGDAIDTGLTYDPHRHGG